MQTADLESSYIVKQLTRFEDLGKELLKSWILLQSDGNIEWLT